MCKLNNQAEAFHMQVQKQHWKNNVPSVANLITLWFASVGKSAAAKRLLHLCKRATTIRCHIVSWVLIKISPDNMQTLLFMF